MTKQERVLEYYREYGDTHPCSKEADFTRPNGDTLIVYQNNGRPFHMRFIDPEGNSYLVCRGKKINN